MGFPKWCKVGIALQPSAWKWIVVRERGRERREARVGTHNMAAMASSILSLASPRSLTICTSSRLTSRRAFSVGGTALWRESSSRCKEGQEVRSTKHGWRGWTWNALEEESPADEERRFSLEEETEKILQGDESQVRGKKTLNFV